MREHVPASELVNMIKTVFAGSRVRFHCTNLLYNGNMHRLEWNGSGLKDVEGEQAGEQSASRLRGLAIKNERRRLEADR